MELKPKEDSGGQKAGLLLNITERERDRERGAGNGRTGAITNISETEPVSRRLGKKKQKKNKVIPNRTLNCLLSGELLAYLETLK